MKNRYLKTIIKVNDDFIRHAIKDDKRICHDNLKKMWDDSNHDKSIRDRELIKIVQEAVSSWLQVYSTRIEWSDSHWGIPEPRVWALDGIGWDDIPDIVFSELQDEDAQEEYQQAIDRRFS